MALFRKAVSILGRTVNSRISQETSVSNLSIFQAIRCMSRSRVFVAGLSYNTDEQGLREFFDKYGEVVDVRVFVGRDGRSRGFGLVTFASAEEASAAIQALDLQELDGRTVGLVAVKAGGESESGGDAAGGYGGGAGTGGYAAGGESESGGDVQNFGGAGSYGSGTADGGFGNNFTGGAGEGSYREDDTPENFADKRG